MYTIGQVSEMFSLPISTLRYYDKEGLFPQMERSSGIRRFSERELEALRVIECLKRSGLEIKEIKQFMQWCAEGSSTYPQRHELFVQQMETVKAEMSRLEKTLDCGNNELHRDKGHVHHGDIKKLRNLFLRHIAEVRALKIYDALVIPELPRELPVADVNGIDLRRAVLQKYVRKSTGRSTAVNAGLARRIDRKDLQRLVELESSAADERQRDSAHFDVGVRIDRHPRLVRTLPVNEHNAAHNGGFRPLTAFGEAEFKYALIQSDFFHALSLIHISEPTRH